MSRKLKDYTEAVALYQGGASTQAVADVYGMTRQAMWDILNTRGVAMRSRLRYGEANHFYRGGEKADDQAQNAVETALQKGVLIRKNACELCGSSGTFKDGRTAIQAHHPDYNHPLDVMWLCQKCHHEWHRTHEAIRRKESA